MTINEKWIQSPLNYTGGKYKLLPQIMPCFPKGINTFVDLFCGGGNVGINVDCRRLVLNDLDEHIFYLFDTFQKLDKEVTFETIRRIIARYGLSDSTVNGYGFYGCNGSDGLGRYNKEPFIELRQNFNEEKNRDASYYLLLYTLIIFSFNNQIRFNREGKFNLPVGKRDFNAKMQRKLSDFIDRLKCVSCVFSCVDFRNFDISALTGEDFVYMDPPYLITCATYNEKDGWNETAERNLLGFIDELHSHGIRFALSNVLRSKGKENRILIEWAAANADRYHVKRLDYDYANSNYHTKNRDKNSEEVLIVNY
ncbi:MAG: DNA adenine methylase [Lachnospiraceae bacterium]|nr:DNA adenine methylase [Lachnospiraceae bacterium]